MKRYELKNPRLTNWLGATALGGFALGAAAMYLADPALGKPRRMRARDTLRTTSARTGKALGRAMRKRRGELPRVHYGEERQIHESGSSQSDTLAKLAQAESGVQRTRNKAVSARESLVSAARRLPVGALLAAAGLGYALQSLGKRMRQQPDRSRAAARQESIHLQKSIHIQASPETVFNIWAKYDNFPQFMPGLLDVQSLGMQRSHWTMQGPSGVNLEWNAILTKYMEPTMLAWKTEADAPIEHNGSVRFEAANGGTLATVRMFYGPGMGRPVGDLALLFGDDPERVLDEALERMKNYIEGKNFPRDMNQVASSAGQVLH